MIPYCILAIDDDDDRRFMTALFQNYSRLMYHEIIMIVNDPWVAEDLMQEVLVKLIDKVKELRTKDRNHLVNYIIAASKNRARNYLRDNRERSELSLEEDDVQEPAGSRVEVDSRLMWECDLESLARVWSRLSERSRHLLEGRYILEKPIEQLAGELGIKPGSVRMALIRARNEAYHLLKNEMYPQI